MASTSRSGSKAGAASAAAAASHGAPKSPESFASLERRNEAARISQSYEELSWFSFARGESLTQTRLHFQNVVAGFPDEDEAALVDWRTDNRRRSKPDEDSRRSSKGKDRASVGADVDSAVPGPSAQKKDKSNDAGMNVESSNSRKRKSGSAG